MQNYTVQAGDTLFSIAQKLLNNGSRWTEITDVNGQHFTEESAKYVRPGDVVLVPTN